MLSGYMLIGIISLPVLYAVYWAMKKHVRIQNGLVLAVSFLVYGLIDPRYLIFLACSIGITYFGGRIGFLCTEKNAVIGRRVYWLSIFLNLFILVFSKYTSFTLTSLHLLFNTSDSSFTIPTLLLPIGLSFYIFQSSTYLFSLLQGKEKPERNLIDYALFVSFLPTIIAGPIQRSYHFLPQIKARKSLSYETFQSAVLLFLWGAFQKLVIADRIALFTNEVFGHYESYAGVTVIISAALYSIQIYTDFEGYSCMVIALSRLLGYQLADNFCRPYLATSVQNFWRRWHISLTSWLTDYVYIPLGGNRKGTLRKYINLLIVFLVSGMWHGAAWHFVVWGMLHGLFQIIERLTLQLRIKLSAMLHMDRTTTGFIWWERSIVFILMTFAWVFFRADSVSDAVCYIGRMFAEFNPWVLFDSSLTGIGISQGNWQILLCALLLLLVISLKRESGMNSSEFIKQNPCTKGICYIVLFFSIVIFGIYGPTYSASSFIYAGF